MEADWEFEVAADAPVIDAAWSGLVDLRRQPERAAHLPESDKLPGLATAVVRLNQASSRLWTAKCDVWEPEPIDADEFDATPETAVCVLACYIDVLPADQQTWATLDSAADWCRDACAQLRASTLRQCRADLIIRRACTAPDESALGVTAYLAGCGATPDAAAAMLAAALHAFVDTACNETRAPQPAKSYNE